MSSSQRTVRTRSMADEKLKSDIEELKAIQLQDISDLKSDMQKLLQGQSNMQKLINTQIEANKSKDLEIKRLNNRVDELEQYTRRDDVIINGLTIKPRSFARVTASHPVETEENAPSQELESVESQVLSYLNSNDIELSPSEISVCHPIASKDKNKPPSIVIRFVSRKTKERLLKSAKKLKGTSVFTNEHLTNKNAHIARDARALVKQNKLKGTWTRNGTVFVKYEERGGTVKVQVIKDVDMLQQFKG